MHGHRSTATQLDLPRRLEKQQPTREVFLLTVASELRHEHSCYNSCLHSCNLSIVTLALVHLLAKHIVWGPRAGIILV